jgi:[calcium/calmodulin-dependent protein kinase] kinase
LKIVDFGVSEMFTKKGDDMIKKSAGSPAFMAPELCRSHGEVSGKPTDLWSMGVTLFCIRYGRLPFKSGMSLELQKMINEDEPDLGDEQDPRFRTTITRLLEKGASKRITIDELRVR